MDINNIGQFIKKSLEYYDEQQEKYKEYINATNLEFNERNNELIINLPNQKPINATYETLGYYDTATSIWIWAWVINTLKSESTEIARNLLNYGLKLEPDKGDILEHFFIKTLLVNSRILIDDEIQLDTNIAVYSYLLKGKFSFILPRRIKNNSIIYCLIKL